ncbi:hypothetical protein [Methylophaga nitratireducenticrescens]|uniref:hypothetical protein n=1 Tax=Methylophaga nitratireducenticrescens TaxID=754476 RepID=UPI000CDC96A8|nr:hypothetical protein [Methylophaga nitratireducenticrescens]AUZ85811.1 hypothetical protein CDW43_15110 [Methylophaga nitratireducenticrescens]AUZ85879.1 hypothetical protein CDW43_15465 [Methylophaga nitratireducenticrescens]
MKKPVHILQADGLLHGQQAIWQCIRTLKIFTLFDIETLSTDSLNMNNVNGETARDYVKRLEKAGYVERLEREQGVHSRIKWLLIKDTGLNAPRLDKQGNAVPESKRDQLWRAIKILNVFDAHSLVASTDESCGITLIDAKDYIYHLHKAGYLQCVAPASNNGTSAKYRLLSGMNTGPKAPMVQRVKHVFDQNLNKVVWPKPIQEEV